MEMDRGHHLLIGACSEVDAQAHRPCAPEPGVGIYSVRLGRDGRIEPLGGTASLNPAVMIAHADGRHLNAIQETIRENGSIERYRVADDGSSGRCDTFHALGRSTCFLALSERLDAAVVINYRDARNDVCSVDANRRPGEVHQSFRQGYRADSDWRQVTDREVHRANRQVGSAVAPRRQGIAPVIVCAPASAPSSRHGTSVRHDRFPRRTRR